MYLPSNVKHINDKFIFGENGEQSINTTSNYTTQLAETKYFNKPYEVAVVDFTYRHSWKLNIGSLTIVFKNDLKNEIEQKGLPVNNKKLHMFNSDHPWYKVPDVDLNVEDRKLKYQEGFELFDDQLTQVFPLSIIDGEDIEQFFRRLEDDIKKFYTELLYTNRYNVYREKKKKYPDYKYNQELDAIEPYNKDFFFKDDNLLINLIQDEFTFSGLPKFSFGSFGFKIALGHGVQLEFRGPICRILKLSEDLVIYKKNKDVKIAYESLLATTKSINLTQMLFIYTDIIPPQVVGDTRASLIRTVHVENDHQKGSFISFENPQYFPVNKTEISSINININDETGKPVQFINSLVSVTLHFRPILN
jgi:hypothetical protein